MDLTGIGSSGAARLLVDVGDIHRFADRDTFAAWNGTAPLDVSSGEQKRHRLSRVGNRRINRALHIMAVVQLRHRTEGRAYFDAKKAAGKRRWRRCARSSAGSPTSYTPRCSPTRNDERRQARDGTLGRLCNPA
jgi:transposase